MPELRRFPRQIAAVGLVLALLGLAALVGWRLHDQRAPAGGDGAVLVLARVGTG